MKAITWYPLRRLENINFDISEFYSYRNRMLPIYDAIHGSIAASAILDAEEFILQDEQLCFRELRLDPVDGVDETGKQLVYRLSGDGVPFAKLVIDEEELRWVDIPQPLGPGTESPRRKATPLDESAFIDGLQSL